MQVKTHAGKEAEQGKHFTIAGWKYKPAKSQ